MKSKPNHTKIAEVISAAIPIGYVSRMTGHRMPDSDKRAIFEHELYSRSWAAFGLVMEWVKDKGLTWEIETNIDDYCDAVLFTAPDDDDRLYEIVRDSTYGEISARLSCVCAAIVVEEL